MIVNQFDTEKGHFEYTYVGDFDFNELPEPSAFKNGYLDVPAAFDIESTSYYSKKYKKDVATMWIWQFGLLDHVIIGRTWYEFADFMTKLDEWAGKKGDLLILVHNFSFEFQWIKGWLEWNRNPKSGTLDIFAKTDRSILYAKFSHLEFRDSLALTDLSLAKLQKNYGLEVGKLKGDLDYSVIRHSGTKTVTHDELAYCINDVKVLCDLFKKYISPEFFSQNKKLPLTSTGLVRQDMAEEFKMMSKEDQKKWRNRIRNAQPSEQLYQIFREWLFRGGFVHANTIACNYLGEEPFWSEDLKSAHPSQILLHDFPYRFHKRNNKCFKEVLDDARSGEFAFFGIFKFHNIRSKTYHSYESKSKIIDETGGKYENGRLIEAVTCKVCITDIDWKIYEMMYEWDSVEVKLLYQAKYEPLPDYVRKTTMKYFVLKETLPKDTVEYQRSKRKLNSVFGCMATSLPSRELVFNPETNSFELSAFEREYDELIRWLILLPQWAIWTAAYTRLDIARGITEDGNTTNYGLDYIYYDTDSLKVRNPETHKWWFDKFNEEKRQAVLKMECYDFDRSLFMKIGSFDFEYRGDRFKVMGAKRYLVEHDGDCQVTCAGMVKGSLERYCEANDLDIWEEFTDNLYLSEEWSMKKTTVYTDSPIKEKLRDFEGNVYEIEERSCVAIVDIPFTMSIEAEFANRISILKHERERMIYKGVW